MRNRFFKSATLTFGQQIGRMADRHPSFQAGLTRGVASWTGELQPSPISESYTVRIEYTLRMRPVVRVLRPQLRERTPGERIPHTFPDGSVCLHVNEDWTPASFIADTIIPWLALWLYHYESWHATGEWLGGGHEPRKKK
jgi:hypothetical protein